MLKLLTTLKREFSGKRLYVLDVTRTGTRSYIELVVRGIHVSGFVSRNPNYVGETIMGVPVVSFADLEGDADALVVAGDHVTSAARKAAGGVPCIVLAELFELDPELRGKSVRIFDAGPAGWDTLKRLGSGFAQVEGLVTRWREECSEVAGLPIQVFDKVAWTQDDILVVAPEQSVVADGVVAYIAQSGFPGTLYVWDFYIQIEMWGIDWVALVDNALRTGKRIVAYCDTPLCREFCERLMRTCGVRIDRIEDGDIWELADEDPAQCLLIVDSFARERRCEMVEAAYDMGFSLADRNLASLHKATHNFKMESGQYAYESDSRLGVSIDFTPFGGLPGWAVHGDPACEGARIMVLGGSTSSEVYVGESWPSRLHKLLEADGIDNVIFNGAHESNSAHMELLRMERDICWLKPTVVVSMSGVNDRMPARDKFDAARGENPVASWKRTERHMKAIAESEGARFYVFYQPNNISKQAESIFEAIFSRVTMSGDGRMAEEIRSDDFYINLRSLFWNKPEAYIDVCHYSDEGNAELARVVYDTIKDSL